MLLFLLPVLALAASLTGLVAPRQAQALEVCNYFCIDPGLTCCFTCYRIGSQCVCPEYCSIDPER